MKTKMGVPVRTTKAKVKVMRVMEQLPLVDLEQDRTLRARVERRVGVVATRRVASVKRATRVVAVSASVTVLNPSAPPVKSYIYHAYIRRW